MRDCTQPAKEKWLMPIVILAGLVLLRAAYLLVYATRLPYLAYPLGDAGIYLAWARQIAAGAAPAGVFYRAPLYPYLLALGLKLGATPLTVAVCQMALGIATVFIVFLTGRRLFGERAGLIGMALCGLSAPLVTFETKLLSATLVVLLVTLGTWLIVRTADRRHHRLWFWAGLCFGLATIAWAGAAVIFVGLGTWAVAGRVAGRKALPLGIAACLAVVAVMTVRNGVVGRDFVPISSNAGFTLYQGNNRLAVGTLAQPPEMYEFRYQGRLLTGIAQQDTFEQRYVESILGPGVKPSRVSRFWTGRALDWIVHHPGAGLVLMARKLVLALSDYESPSDHNLYLETSFAWPLHIAFMRFGILLGLATLGVLLAGRKAAWPLYSVLLGTLVALMLVYVADRYRLTAFPALAVLGGAGLNEAWRRARSKKLQAGPVTASVAVTLMSMVAFTLPLHRGSALLMADALRNLGEVYASRAQDIARARAAYEQAAALYSNHHNPASRQERLAYEELLAELSHVRFQGQMFSGAVGKAQAELAQGDTSRAVAQLKAALERDSVDPDAVRLLGSVLGAQGQHAEVARLFTRAVAAHPDDPVLRYNLALAALNAQNYTLALQQAETLAMMVPDHPWAIRLLEQARAALR
jgi:4-amino-4-deoxy-L-arabinose transferase-like glycosyltransferase